MRTALFALVAAAASSEALAQSQYTFEIRLIPDGAAGAPSGPWQTYPLGDPANVTATRIGFWLQARVSVTGGAENWGIVRAASPAGDASFITASANFDVSVSRGSTNGGNSIFGRGSGYRNGGAQTGNTGNDVGSAPFPGTANNENGALDNGGSGSLTRRVYGFNSWVGDTRAAANPDEPSQPWNVNGASGAGSPVPSGQFSPWASLYRVWIDITPFASPGPGNYPQMSVSASAWLTGSIAAVPTDASQQTWQMLEGPGQLLTASYSFYVVPTPGAAAAVGLAGVFASRRRR
ncbi:MAG: hypothetical protein QM783_00865 [Phycisphaerales bacterium]